MVETKAETYWILRRKSSGEYYRSSQTFCSFIEDVMYARRFSDLTEAREYRDNMCNPNRPSKISRKELVGELEILQMRVRLELESVL
jgi:hypothetical protein